MSRDPVRDKYHRYGRPLHCLDPHSPYCSPWISHIFAPDEFVFGCSISAVYVVAKTISWDGLFLFLRLHNRKGRPISPDKHNSCNGYWGHANMAMQYIILTLSASSINIYHFQIQNRYGNGFHVIPRKGQNSKGNLAGKVYIFASPEFVWKQKVYIDVCIHSMHRPHNLSFNSTIYETYTIIPPLV